MSTKVMEPCPTCTVKVMPTDKALAVEVGMGVDVPVRMWRYKCPCGWVWANYDQRTHNYHVYSVARREAYNKGWI